jgi:ArsR family transcriptional regulator
LRTLPDPAAVSHHAKLLVDAGLITREQRGQWACDQVGPGAPLTLSDTLTGA